MDDKTLYTPLTLDVQHINFPDVIAVSKDTLRGWQVTPLNDGALLDLVDGDACELWSISASQDAPVFSEGQVADGKLILPILPEMLQDGYVTQTVILKRATGTIRFGSFRLWVDGAVDDYGATGGAGQSKWQAMLDKLNAAMAKSETYRNDSMTSASLAADCQKKACECATKAEESKAQAEASAAQALKNAQGVDQYSKDAKASAEAAKASETAAQTSAETASAKAGEATTSASQAQSSATSAATYSSQAAASADEASGSASTAASMADGAKIAANAAASSAVMAKDFSDAAQASASASAKSAGEAKASATTASTEAGKAESASTSAQESKTAAETSATEAGKSAGEAKTSARAAKASEEQAQKLVQDFTTDEEDRKTAEQARAAKETERANAEQARATKEAERAQAESDRQSAEEARATAERARADQAGKDHTQAEADHRQYATDQAEYQALKETVKTFEGGQIAEKVSTMETKLADIEEGANNYTLPVATDTTLGGVKVGAGLDLASDGTISAQEVDLTSYATKEEVKKDLSGKADKSHTHQTSDITGLDQALKEAGQVQSVNDKTGAVKINAVPDGGTTGQVLKKTSTGYAWGEDKDTKPDLSAYAKTTDVDKKLDKKVDKIEGKGLSTNDYDKAAKAKVDGIPNDPKYTDTTYSNATSSKPGLMSGADKSKLDGIEAEATKTTVLDSLTSTSTTSALSANQGRALKEQITQTNDKFGEVARLKVLTQAEFDGLSTKDPGTLYLVKEG